MEQKMKSWRFNPKNHTEKDIDKFFDELKAKLKKRKKPVTIIVAGEGRKERENLLWKLIGDLADNIGYSREQMKKTLIMQTDGISVETKLKCSMKEMTLNEFELFFDYVVWRHEKEIGI